MLSSARLFPMFLFAALPLTAVATTINLHADVAVSAVVYRLRDIARVTGSDATRIAAMKIGVTPRPGKNDRLSQAQVKKAIERHFPDLRGMLHWSGSQTVTIHGTGIAVDGQHLIQLASDSLQHMLRDRYAKVEIKPVDSIRDVLLPEGAELRVRPWSGTISRRIGVWIDVNVEGRAYTAVPVWFAVKAWTHVPVARRDLPAGQQVKEVDFAMELRDVLQTTKTLEHLPPDGTALLRRAVAQGSPLTNAVIEMAPAISRNQQVVVKLASGGIAIETSGLAQSTGRIGDSVTVKNPGSSEVFLAKVVAPGVVTVNAR